MNHLRNASLVYLGRWHIILFHIKWKEPMDYLWTYTPPDVCPLIVTSCVKEEGASYFITFIDDFNCYGYVYLMKHKHEGYALESAARILNMFPTKKVEMTPYEIWHGKAPKLSYLRVWGCETLVKRDAPDKLDPRSIKCIFVGYPKEYGL
ncbi:hypothetical protein Tco_0661084 [Tanacetum coccineum]